MVKKLINGILAGILISMGGSVYLGCENKIAGAVLFSVALICICYLNYALYTGKICFMVDTHDKESWSVLLLCILGNLIGTFLFGLMIRYAVPSIGSAAETVCQGKLDNQVWWQTLIRGFMCGILIYLAVIIYKVKNTIAGIVFCIPVFILSGFEHSIADMFYFSASGIYSLKACLFIWLVIAGNSLGGMLIPFLLKLSRGKKQD